MRVIGGSARGRKISAPPGRDTRPITDRAKEAIFNMLMSLGGLDGARVLDLYAGSGSFGLEALSRGAHHVSFVERDRVAVAVMEANLDLLGFRSRATVLATSVEGALDTVHPVDIAFCDPPYAVDPWAELLPRIPAQILVAHADHDIEMVPPWTEIRRRRYGRSRVVIATSYTYDSEVTKGVR